MFWLTPSSFYSAHWSQPQRNMGHFKIAWPLCKSVLHCQLDSCHWPLPLDHLLCPTNSSIICQGHFSHFRCRFWSFMTSHIVDQSFSKHIFSFRSGVGTYNVAFGLLATEEGLMEDETTHRSFYSTSFLRSCGYYTDNHCGQRDLFRSSSK